MGNTNDGNGNHSTAPMYTGPLPARPIPTPASPPAMTPPGKQITLKGTVLDMPNIHKMLTIIGNRFGHQSGLDESSGRNFNICL